MSETEILSQAEALARAGERGAARVLLGPLENATGALGRAARACLAAMDEMEGRQADAVARWQRSLAERIDDDEAWAHLSRLASERGTAQAASPMPLAAATLDSGVGVRFSRFEILGELGRGAFATVYRGRDRALGLELALKVLHPRAGGQRGDEAFFAEARKVAGLRHPGIVATYDIDPSLRTLVLELVPGGTLRDHLRAGPGEGRLLPASEWRALAIRLLAALAHLHAHGVVHGDLSPRNVLLRGPGDPVLIDFGVAWLDDAGDRAAGTPLYLAPEQFAGSPPSESADLFATGAILWEAALGRPMRTRDDLIAGRTLAPPYPGAVELSDGTPIARVLTGLTSHAPAERAAAARAIARWAPVRTTG